MFSLNPYRWFVPDPLRFLEEAEKGVFSGFKPIPGVSEKVMIKEMKKIFGEDLQYMFNLDEKVSNTKSALAVPKEFFEAMVRNGHYGHMFWIIGKGAKYLKKKDEIPGFKHGKDDVDESRVTHRLKHFVYGNIQRYLGMSKTKFPEIDRGCPSCGQSFSLAIENKVSVDEDGDEIEEDCGYNVLYQGDCRKCGTTILEMDDSEIRKWFRKMYLFQEKEGMKVFSKSNWY